MFRGTLTDLGPHLIQAIRVCERRGLLFYELLSRLRRIRQEFGDQAALSELALQAALADEEAAWQRDQAEHNKPKRR